MQAWRQLITSFNAFWSIAADTTSHREKLIAAAGALLGILAVYSFSAWWLEGPAMGWMLASMGASAVLLFAVPHGALSQPWSVLGGHLLSALVGVSCYQWLGDWWGTGALAVGLSVAAMGYLRCIHPPGGATALAAVIGGESIYALGYAYLLTPVLLNVGAILLLALAYNNLFSWRRYPVAFMSRHVPDTADATPVLTHEDFAAAMEELDTYVDITSEELADLFARAWHHARESEREPIVIAGGHFYSNGAAGDRWAVRQIIDLPEGPLKMKARMIYKNVAGCNAYETGMCTVEEFHHWVRFEVVQRGERWRKVIPGA